jgi:hypothetical protein
MTDQNNPKHFAIVVHACDRYEILFRGFEYFFKTHWTDTNNVSLYFLTEEKDYVSKIFKNVKTGKGEWSDRLRIGLKQISEPYIIYIQEDMWLNKDVNSQLLNSILNYTLAEKPQLLKLHSSGVYVTNPTNTIIEGLTLSKLDNEGSKYLMSHQLSIWNREFFISQLQNSEHPWRHERKGTKRMKKLNIPIFQIDFFAENGKTPINENLSNEKRSEYQTISVNGILNTNALPFLEILTSSSDPVISAYGEKLMYNFKNQVTHDGLSKPRKEDIFQKLKKIKF